MASVKKITMREYNGTDYDTLYPKTIASQVDGVYTKEESISASTRTALGLATNATPDAALAEIARQLSESGIVQMELLWENASPSSDFAAQTIAIDLSEYALVAVEITQGGVSFARVDGEAKEIGAQFGSPNGRTRYYSAKSDGVTFSDGYYGYWNSGNAWTANGGICRPLRIYGVKISA